MASGDGLSQRRNVGLDGVVTHRKSGFKLAYPNIRHEGVGGGAEPGGLSDFSYVVFDEIARYDEIVFPAPEASLHALW